jgi:hypothetical protein
MVRMSQVRPETYEVRIRGRLGPGFREAFEAFEMIDVPAETVVRCAGLDQAGLHGMLDRLRSYGLELVEVRRIGERETAWRSSGARGPWTGDDGDGSVVASDRDAGA